MESSNATKKILNTSSSDCTDRGDKTLIERKQYARKFSERILNDAYLQIRSNCTEEKIERECKEMVMELKKSFIKENDLTMDHFTYSSTICAKVFTEAYDQLRKEVV